ncbi:MAG: nuclear transport factor 2 family protein, partial [bacterium]|nr:nuclear transport factor 2 family protein [bacterium]
MNSEFKSVYKVIEDSIGWAETKDTELLYSCFSHDENLFWFTPESNGTLKGFDNFVSQVNSFFLDKRFKSIGHEIRDMKIDFSKNSDVAWWSCMLDDINEWDKKRSSWINVRWTGVLEKREGRWVI